MSRSEYSDDYDDDGKLALYRGAVERAIKGRRGQAFLKEMKAALEALPEKKLVEGELEMGGEVCALGAVGKARGMDMSTLDPENAEMVAKAFGIAPSMAREITFENDDDFGYYNSTPEGRYQRMMRWIESNLK